MIKKEDFDLVLKETVLKAWEEIQKIMNQFTYFKSMDVVTKRECSIVSRTKLFQPEETILGDGIGLTNFVHFVAKGTCCVIEHLVVEVTKINGVKHYKLHNMASEKEEEDKQSDFEKSRRSRSESFPSRGSVRRSRSSRSSRRKQSVNKRIELVRMSKNIESRKKSAVKGSRSITEPDATIETRLSRVVISEPPIQNSTEITGKYSQFVI